MQVDEQLWSGEDDVEDQTAPGEGAAEEEGAEQPEEAMDGEGDVESLIKAAGVVRGEGFGRFLGSVSAHLKRSARSSIFA